MSIAAMLPKGIIQEQQYSFPYHHLPVLRADGSFSRQRTLSWGDEYLCYLYHTKELIENLQPSSMLEVGCGDGRFIGMMSPNILKRAGVDISARAISFAKAFCPDVDFSVADVASLSEKYDVVAAVEVLEHIPDELMAGFLKAIHARTKPGGHIVVTVPSTVKPLQAKHYRHYTLNTLESHIAQAGIPCSIAKSEFVYRPSVPLRIFRKLTTNRLWSLEIPLLERTIWSYVWGRLRYADEKSGYHLIAVLKNEDRV